MPPRCCTESAQRFEDRTERAWREAHRYRVVGPLSRAERILAARKHVMAMREAYRQGYQQGSARRG